MWCKAALWHYFVNCTTSLGVQSRMEHIFSRVSNVMLPPFLSVSSIMVPSFQITAGKNIVIMVKYSKNNTAQKASASLGRLFAPLPRFQKREILRSRCRRKSAYGCGIPLAGTYSIPTFPTPRLVEKSLAHSSCRLIRDSHDNFLNLVWTRGHYKNPRSSL